MHSPDHVCEALEWMYGMKWHSHGHGNCTSFLTYMRGRLALRGLEK